MQVAHHVDGERPEVFRQSSVRGVPEKLKTTRENGGFAWPVTPVFSLGVVPWGRTECRAAGRTWLSSVDMQDFDVGTPPALSGDKAHLHPHPAPQTPRKLPYLFLGCIPEMLPGPGARETSRRLLEYLYMCKRRRKNSLEANALRKGRRERVVVPYLQQGARRLLLSMCRINVCVLLFVLVCICLFQRKMMRRYFWARCTCFHGT